MSKQTRIDNKDWRSIQALHAPTDKTAPLAKVQLPRVPAVVVGSHRRADKKAIAKKWSATEKVRNAMVAFCNHCREWFPSVGERAQHRAATQVAA